MENRQYSGFLNGVKRHLWPSARSWSSNQILCCVFNIKENTQREIIMTIMMMMMMILSTGAAERNL